MNYNTAVFKLKLLWYFYRNLALHFDVIFATRVMSYLRYVSLNFGDKFVYV